MVEYYKVVCEYLGVVVLVIDDLVWIWCEGLDLFVWLDFVVWLWDSDVYEGCIVVVKLLM